MNVGPTVVGPSHHFSLTDGTHTLGLILSNQKGEPDPIRAWQQAPMPRTAMKISQGSQGYQDFELPFTSIEMQSWIGGMNAENFEEDTSKYRDGRRIDTTRGDIISGPKATKVTDILTLDELDYLDFASIEEATGSVYGSFTPAANITVSKVSFPNKDFTELLGNGKIGYFTVTIYTDSAGEPDTIVGTGTLVNLAQPSFITMPLNEATSLTASTTYWIKFTKHVARYFNGVLLIGSSIENKYQYIHTESGESVIQHNDVGGGFTTLFTNSSLSFRLYGTSAPIENVRFFEHRRAIYCVVNPEGGGAPSLYLNGYLGCASSNAADLTKLNTDQNLSDASLAGSYALIVDGPGSKEEQPWRRIVSNTTTGTSDVITVEKPWQITHTTATSFVIIGSNEWNEITGHGLTGKVTDVEIVYDYVAFAQGDAINMRQFRWRNNSGSSVNEFRADGTNKADILLAVTNTEGTMKLWKALVGDNQVDYADAVYYGSDHAFSGSPITIGSSKYDNITGMVAYGDPLIPYIFKENSFGSIQNNVYAEIPVGEMAALRSENNGIASMKHNVYLYFNLAEKIQQYYDRRLTNYGPDMGEGLPEIRQGVIRKLMPYPGRFYSLLYTYGGVPSLLCHNGYGWNEMWRATRTFVDGTATATGEAAPFAYVVADEPGGRCGDMITQTIPGSNVGRIWFDYGGELYFIQVALNPNNESEYEYADLAQLETAWIYGSLKDVIKYWHSVKLHTENLSGSSDDSQIIKVEYKTDTDTSWTTAGYINTSPIDELDLSSSYNVTGYRIKFRFTLHTADSDITPRIVAAVVKGVIRVEVKKGWAVTVLVTPNKDLTGNSEVQSGILAQLDEWANSDLTAAPLLMRHNLSYYDNHRVFIEPASVVPKAINLEPVKGQDKRGTVEIASFTMYEV